MALLYSLFAKFVPIISIWELRAGMPRPRPATAQTPEGAERIWRTEP
jgi:hypothetical protein